MTVFMSALPIDALLPQICNTLKQKARLVLAAPPGAGKTTRVPLALAGLIEGLPALPGKIVMLEPRRIAARMAAARMADTLGEPLGRTIGLSTRIDRRVSKDTLIEVITDGLFTRRLLADPDLSGVSAVIFDEVHERGLNGDLGLTLALEVQAALRDDLHLLAMSATLDTARLSAVLDAPIIESDGRQYPVETRYLGRTRDRIEDQMARAIERASRETTGSVLAFLPGAGEIRRTAERLNLPDDITIAPLYGALSPQAQDAAISPAPDGQRKIVLATDIAESALTIEGVSVVVDSGLARVPEYDPSGASAKLTTIRAARANVDQRRGRAGRLGPGICYRLWDEAETRGLIAAPAPEILNADLSGLLLALADWGERDPTRLTWIDAPPAGRLKAARAQLTALGALQDDGALTPKGKAMANLPLASRLAALVVSAASPGETAMAARIAALASEAGIGGQDADLRTRLTHFARETSARAKALRRQAASWGGEAKPTGDPALILAKAWPDRLARRRTADNATYLLASGRAAQLDETAALAKSEWLVVADMIGSAKSARITLAASLSHDQALAAAPIETREEAVFDPASRTFKARKVKAIGAITLSETPLPKPSGEAARAAYLAHIKQNGFLGVGLADTVSALCARIAKLRALYGEAWPAWDLGERQDSVDDWLAPVLGQTAFTLPKPATVLDAAKARLDWPLPRDLDQLAPTHVKLPSGRSAPIDWLDDRAPLVEARVQELYGAAAHLHIAEGRAPITIQMLSPGGKPVATTQDLPGFWAGGYADMAKDMRGRYPKHDWPDDPASAKPHAGMTKARLAKG